MSSGLQVIAAEGEQRASRALKEAADVISESPSALQLRYLQTLATIATEKNSTIVFPVSLYTICFGRVYNDIILFNCLNIPYIYIYIYLYSYSIVVH